MTKKQIIENLSYSLDICLINHEKHIELFESYLMFYKNDNYKANVFNWWIHNLTISRLKTSLI